MNKTYRLIWNELTQAWVAVSEITKSRGKRVSAASLSTLSWIAMAAPPTPPIPPLPTQLPTGGQVVAGQAGIVQSGAAMTVTQTTNRAAIDWQTFNIGSQAHVHFQQPSASSATLNRVLDPNPSQIFGRLTANGQVFLTNPSGIYFGRSASVDVGGLVATTHRIGTADFMAGKNVFNRAGASGSVINDGTLQAKLQGYIALLAPEVRNQGVVIARLGTVALAAGEGYELEFADDARLAGIRVAPTTLKTLVDNAHAIEAPDGLVILSARAVEELQGGIVRHSGTVEASSLTAKGGRIVLEGDDIQLTRGSRLDATGATGGGEVLVGGNWQGSGDMHQATRVNMAQGATIDVSATKVGAGGTAVLWSDIANPASQTRAHGEILAKGGAGGGNGGRIETSGHWLNTAGVSGSAAAPKGLGGFWLFDPYNVTITGANLNGAFGGGNPDTWTPSGNSSTILNTDINTKLDAGTSVIITTSGAGGQSGWIDVSSPISKTAGADTSLTLQATTNIYVKAAISSSSNKLNVDLQPKQGGSVGSIWVSSTGSITSNGGNITGTGGVGNFICGNASNCGRGVTIAGPLDAGGGNVSLSGTVASGVGVTTARGVSIEAAVATTGSGTITINGTAGGTNAEVSSDGVGSNAAGTITAGTGTISITGSKAASGNSTRNGINLSGAITTSGNLTLNSTSGHLVSSGAHTVGGTTTLSTAAGFNTTLISNTNNFGGVVSLGSGANFSLIDSNALSLGAINVSGLIDIATLTGNLTLTGNVATSSTSASAIKLNAGKNSAAGTASGGDILVSGSPTVTVGAGGTATLYSGSVTGSTGLTSLIGSASGRFRYNSDEAASNFTTALSTGVNAIYREAPTVTIAANSAGKTYDGLAYSGGNGVSYSGFVNGDTSSILAGTLAYGGTSQGATSAGTYTITPSGLSNGLGYTLSLASGALTIFQQVQVSNQVQVVNLFSSDPSSFLPTNHQFGWIHEGSYENEFLEKMQNFSNYNPGPYGASVGWPGGSSQSGWPSTGTGGQSYGPYGGAGSFSGGGVPQSGSSGTPPIVILPNGQISVGSINNVNIINPGPNPLTVTNPPLSVGSGTALSPNSPSGKEPTTDAKTSSQKDDVTSSPPKTNKKRGLTQIRLRNMSPSELRGLTFKQLLLLNDDTARYLLRLDAKRERMALSTRQREILKHKLSLSASKKSPP